MTTLAITTCIALLLIGAAASSGVLCLTGFVGIFWVISIKLAHSIIKGKN
jgi:hypothetical protein